MTRQAPEQQQLRPTKADRPTRNPGLAKLEGERWLARRLGLHGVLVVFEGDSTPEMRMHRMRAAIRERGIECVICGRGPDRKPNTYAQAFERLYGEKI